jgi:hypothetical protein
MFATLSVAEEPLSTRLSNVFGVPFVSFIVRVPFELLAPKVSIGEVALKASGVAFESVTVPLAPTVVAPEIAPALVIFPFVLSKPPLTVSPPEDIVVAPPIV